MQTEAHVVMMVTHICVRVVMGTQGIHVQKVSVIVFYFYFIIFDYRSMATIVTFPSKSLKNGMWPWLSIYAHGYLQMSQSRHYLQSGFRFWSKD